MEDARVHAQSVIIPARAVELPGILEIPPKPRGIVLFSHGSGSGRLSPRNEFVSRTLHARGLATLRLDLLTEAEDKEYERRFDIPLLTERLAAAVDWIRREAALKRLPLGLFGASTGAASALRLAALHGDAIAAIVSRGGRPDLAGDVLPLVNAPTLLIVGGDDQVVLELNRKAFKEIKAKKKLAVVPGATHLFEEPGTLQAMAEEAGRWFEAYCTF